MNFIFFVTAFLCFLNFYVALSLRSRLPKGRAVSVSVYLGFSVLLVLQFAAPFYDLARAPFRNAFGDAVFHPFVHHSYLMMGVFSCLFFYTLLADVTALGLRVLVKRSRFGVYNKLVIPFVLAATLFNVGLGLSDARKIEVENVEMRLASLPESFEGFKIAQISDLHIGPFLGLGFVGKTAMALAEAKPDVIVLTGDLADSLAEERKEDLLPLALLSAPHGKYFVTGNHDYYWGKENWTSAVREKGFMPLANEHVVLEKDGNFLVLAGVNDPTSYRIGGKDTPDPQKAAQGAPKAAPKILLAHQTTEVEATRKAGFDAQISGHTHGGQYFPFSLVVGLVQPYLHGLYDIEGFKLYVSRGTGFWGPPLRTGGGGEVTVITLRKERPTRSTKDGSPSSP